MQLRARGCESILKNKTQQYVAYKELTLYIKTQKGKWREIQKKSGVVKLIADKYISKQRILLFIKCHFAINKESVHQEDMTILNA